MKISSKLRTQALVSALALVAFLAAAPGWAAGGSSAPTPPVSPPTLSPEQQAAEDYNAGLRQRDTAWKLEKKLSIAGDGDRAKLEKKLGKTWARAIRDFRSATQNNSRMHQAWSSLGYSLRKTGDYTASLQAYNKALDLAPGYAEAIEYRAEAYLGLNRLDDAKEAYMALFAGDRARANELLEAMQGWVEKRQADPGGLDAGAVDTFASWIEERAELAAQTQTVSELRHRSW